MTWLVVFFLWIKTYLVYKLYFNIRSESIFQELLLFINPLSSTLFLIGISFFFKDKLRKIMIVALSILGTTILYINVLFFRFFNDFLTLPVFFQTSNAQDVQGGITELIKFTDLFLMVDIVLIVYLLTKHSISGMKIYKRPALVVMALSVGIFVLNLGLAQIERPQLLTRSFDRELLVKNIGILNFHVYDAVIQSQTKAQRVFADGSEINEIVHYRREQYKKPDMGFYGSIEGKNIIVLSLESLQDFVINEKVNGKEITPFLNDLIDESLYFENFYHQTAQGKTSDSEFLVDNSLFGRDSGAVFFTHSGNEYQALPEELREKGYYTSVMHANNKSFWNRDLMYQSLGYDQFFDINSYEVTEENSIGWGLKDADFFEQSIDLLKQQPQPYYTKFITLTNHFPFELGEEDRFIDEFNSSSGTVNRYFPTVRYMDYAVEQFFKQMKEEGMYENSVFILYGDHYGISDYHNKAMAMYLGKEEITNFDSIQLQKVPLIIHIPGTDPQTIETVSGQIDLKPTILHLLGINTKENIELGSDLLSPERDSFAVLRDGSFISDDTVYTKGICYDKDSGLETESSQCEPYFERATLDLRYSDQIVFGDLLRFYDR
ncbi:LTA synthase family protein [Bacillus suaedae]|uniref:LTA synthase family protein n=1 Tax=Halalkalibacter suaedae TaxID=2822140 RepID=A0A940WZ98_9BACI|nr:LTA synthase family protein [Bacillus suaedae]MBP3951465.1 LTA synthase family protein [Bacillus suaedae]